MNRTIGNRWNTPGRRYAGGWRQNPWINAICGAVHTQNEIDADATADQDRQQRAAMSSWENEGGRLGILLA